MNSHIVQGGLVIAIVTAAASAVSSCGGGGGWVQSPATGRCYKFIDSMRVNWGTAQSKCSLYGGRLATLRTMDDMIFVNGYRVTRHGFSGDFWLGGRKIGGQWYWMTSPPPQRIAADLMLWEPGQPAHGGDCLQMIARSDGKVRWDDHGCENLKHFICEKA